MERACRLTHLLETNDAYLEFIPPALTPIIFVPGIVSDLNWVEQWQIALSPKGNTT